MMNQMRICMVENMGTFSTDKRLDEEFYYFCLTLVLFFFDSKKYF